MKATGIVRRIDETVIIKTTWRNLVNTRGSADFGPIFKRKTQTVKVKTNFDNLLQYI